MLGPSNGIRILINPHSELYQSNVMWNNYLGEGIVVIVTLDDHFANPVNPIHVAPGSHAMIQLSRTRFDFEIGSFSIFPSPCIQNVGLVTLQGLRLFQFAIVPN